MRDRNSRRGVDSPTRDSATGKGNGRHGRSLYAASAIAVGSRPSPRRAVSARRPVLAQTHRASHQREARGSKG